MADNTVLNTGSGGDTLRTEDKPSLSAKVPVSLIDVAGTADSESIIGDAGVFMPVEGAAAHDAAAAGNPLLVGAEFDDTTPDSVDEGDVGKLRMSANRNLYATIRDAAGNERGLNVDGSGQIAVTQGGTWNLGTVTTVTTVSTVTNLAQLGGQAVSMGTGTRDAGTQRVTIATDDVVPVSQSGTWNVSVDDGGGVLSVDWDGTAPPIGAGTEAAALRVTVATDSTGVLTVDNAGTFAVQADAVIPGTGATNLGKAIDSAAGATDTGVAMLAIRDDALTTLTPVDGDYVGLRVNSTGALHVTGAGGGTQYQVDDAGGATDTGTAMLAIRDDSLTTLTPADGDYVRLRVNSTGALHVTGGGGGTEYVVDAAAPATPTGTASLMERDDALGGLTPIEGDWSHQFCSANGALWVAVDGTVAATQSGTWNITNISGTVSLPTGAATEATLATVETNTDFGTVVGGGVEATALRVTIASDSTGTLTVDNGGTFAVQADSVIPGTGATNLGKAIDAAAGATDTGVVLLATRDDSLSALTPAEGDYVQLRVNSTGALHVTGGGGGTEYTVDAAAPATPTGSAGLMERDDALGGLTPIEGDWSHQFCSANGALWVAVDGTVAATQSGTWNITNVSGTVSLPTGAATEATLATVETNTDFGTVVGGGVEATALRVTIASDSTGVITVDNAGTFAVQAASAGDVAHDGADSGNPVKIGAKAETAISGVTLVADGDRTDLHAGVDGVLITRNHCNLEDQVQERDTNTDGASTAFASGLAAPGAGVRLWITRVTLCNTSSSDIIVDLRDGAAGSVLWTLPVPANGGVIQDFDPPLKLTANTALAYDASAATTTLYISALGFKSKV